MGGQTMNRLIDYYPTEVTMKEVKEECKECNGEGGFYLDLELNDVVSRDEYLMHKDERNYELMPCEECEGKGYIITYIEDESDDDPDWWRIR